MIRNYKHFFKEMGILTIVSFVLSIVLLNYLINNSIMGYDKVIQGSMTIFGFYLNQTGWIVVISFVMSIMISVIVSIITFILNLLWFGVLRLIRLVFFH